MAVPTSFIPKPEDSLNTQFVPFPSKSGILKTGNPETTISKPPKATVDIPVDKTGIGPSAVASRVLYAKVKNKEILDRILGEVLPATQRVIEKIQDKYKKIEISGEDWETQARAVEANFKKEIEATKTAAEQMVADRFEAEQIKLDTNDSFTLNLMYGARDAIGKLGDIVGLERTPEGEDARVAKAEENKKQSEALDIAGKKLIRKYEGVKSPDEVKAVVDRLKSKLDTNTTRDEFVPESGELQQGIAQDVARGLAGAATGTVAFGAAGKAFSLAAKPILSMASGAKYLGPVIDWLSTGKIVPHVTAAGTQAAEWGLTGGLLYGPEEVKKFGKDGALVSGLNTVASSVMPNSPVFGFALKLGIKEFIDRGELFSDDVSTIDKIFKLGFDSMMLMSHRPVSEVLKSHGYGVLSDIAKAKELNSGRTASTMRIDKLVPMTPEEIAAEKAKVKAEYDAQITEVNRQIEKAKGDLTRFDSENISRDRNDAYTGVDTARYNLTSKIKQLETMKSKLQEHADSKLREAETGKAMKASAATSDVILARKAWENFKTAVATGHEQEFADNVELHDAIRENIKRAEDAREKLLVEKESLEQKAAESDAANRKKHQETIAELNKEQKRLQSEIASSKAQLSAKINAAIPGERGKARTYPSEAPIKAEIADTNRVIGLQESLRKLISGQAKADPSLPFAKDAVKETSDMIAEKMTELPLLKQKLRMAIRTGVKADQEALVKQISEMHPETKIRAFDSVAIALGKLDAHLADSLALEAAKKVKYPEQRLDVAKRILSSREGNDILMTRKELRNKLKLTTAMLDMATKDLEKFEQDIKKSPTLSEEVVDTNKKIEEINDKITQLKKDLRNIEGKSAKFAPLGSRIKKRIAELMVAAQKLRDQKIKPTTHITAVDLNKARTEVGLHEVTSTRSVSIEREMERINVVLDKVIKQLASLPSKRAIRRILNETNRSRPERISMEDRINQLVRRVELLNAKLHRDMEELDYGKMKKVAEYHTVFTTEAPSEIPEESRWNPSTPVTHGYTPPTPPTPPTSPSGGGGGENQKTLLDNVPTTVKELVDRTLGSVKFEGEEQYLKDMENGLIPENNQQVERLTFTERYLRYITWFKNLLQMSYGRPGVGRLNAANEAISVRKYHIEKEVLKHFKVWSDVAADVRKAIVELIAIPEQLNDRNFTDAEMKYILMQHGVREEDIPGAIEGYKALQRSYQVVFRAFAESVKDTSPTLYKQITELLDSGKNWISLQRNDSGKRYYVTVKSKDEETLFNGVFKTEQEAKDAVKGIENGSIKVGIGGKLRTFDPENDQLPVYRRLNTSETFDQIQLQEANHMMSIVDSSFIKAIVDMKKKGGPTIAKDIADLLARREEHLKGLSTIKASFLERDLVAGWVAEDVESGILRTLFAANRAIERNNVAKVVREVEKELIEEIQFGRDAVRKAKGAKVTFGEIEPRLLVDALNIIKARIRQPSNAERVVDMLSFMTTGHYIGFRLGTAIANLPAAITHTMLVAPEMKNASHMKNMVGEVSNQVGRAMWDMGKATYLITARAMKGPMGADDLINIFKEVGCTDTESAALAKQIIDGKIRSVAEDSLYSLTSDNPKIRALQEAAFVPHTITEKITRLTTFLAIHRMADKITYSKESGTFRSGNEGDRAAALYEQADRLTRMAHGAQGREGISIAESGKHGIAPLARAAMTLQKWAFNTIWLLQHRMGGATAGYGKDIQSLLGFAAWTMFFGGVSAVTGYRGLRSAWRWGTATPVPGLDDMDDSKNIFDNMIMNGIPTLLGFDLSEQMTIRAPSMFQGDIGGVTGKYVGDIRQAIENARTGSPIYKEILSLALPISIQKIYTSTDEYLHGMRTANGRVVLKDGEPIKPGLGETLIKSIAFSPSFGVAQDNRIRFKNKDLMDYYKELGVKTATRANNLINDGDRQGGLDLIISYNARIAAFEKKYGFSPAPKLSTKPQTSINEE